MQSIAILGFGTVGSGIFEVLREQPAVCESVNIKYILDKRTFPGHPLSDRVTVDFEKILSDPEVSVIAETLGGLDFAYKCTKAALLSGKSVVTSNKAVVDKYGAELEQIAFEQGCCYLYEASSGGGIPIIRPLRTCFTGDRITKICGILNGTTNYILTKMTREGQGFEQALANAQKLGYAEADPHADVSGQDSARKIAILAGIAFDKYISYEQIPFIKGIEDVTAEDITLAQQDGYIIKLLAVAEQHGDKAAISVSPCLVPADNMLASVDYAYNAICLTGANVGNVLFYGMGAGSLPTASAVVTDILEALRDKPVIPARKKANDDYILCTNDCRIDYITLKNGKKYRVL